MITAAAIRVDGKVHTLPPPARHHTILHQLHDDGILQGSQERTQGFIDDELGFVGRLHARHIVVHQKQPLAPKPDGTPRTQPDHKKYLFSEDLW